MAKKKKERSWRVTFGQEPYGSKCEDGYLFMHPGIAITGDFDIRFAKTLYYILSKEITDLVEAKFGQFVCISDEKELSAPAKEG